MPFHMTYLLVLAAIWFAYMAYQGFMANRQTLDERVEEAAKHFRSIQEHSRMLPSGVGIAMTAFATSLAYVLVLLATLLMGWAASRSPYHYAWVVASCLATFQIFGIVRGFRRTSDYLKILTNDSEPEAALRAFYEKHYFPRYRLARALWFVALHLLSAAFLALHSLVITA